MGNIGLTKETGINVKCFASGAHSLFYKSILTSQSCARRATDLPQPRRRPVWGSARWCRGTQRGNSRSAPGLFLNSHNRGACWPGNQRVQTLVLPGPNRFPLSVLSVLTNSDFPTSRHLSNKLFNM